MTTSATIPRLVLELRHAARSLRRSPGYTATAVLSLAIGLGLAATAHVMVDTVRHPYTPVPDVAQVVTLGARSHDRSLSVPRLALYDDLRASAGTLAGVALVEWRRTSIRAGGDAAERVVGVVSPEFFPTMRVRPTLGRTLDPRARSTDEAGVVVSARLWQRLYPGRTAIDGAALHVGDRAYSVVGVMPAGFAIPWDMDAWLLRPTAESRPPRYALVVGRVRDGVEPRRVQAEVLAAARRVATGGDARTLVPIVLPADLPAGPVGAFHVALVGAAAFVLLIACANVANLTLARGLSRGRELALRVALGATRRDLVRHLLAESVLVAAAGLALGVVAAAWGANLLVALAPPSVPLLGELAPRLGWRVLATCAATTLAVILGTGLVPALRASRAAIAEVLKDGSGMTTGRSRSRYAGLVVAEVALSLALLMAAGLLVRAAAKVGTFEFGYDARPVLVADLRLDARVAADAATAARAHADALDRARDVRGVVAAATMQWQMVEGFGVHADVRGGFAATDRVLRVGPEFLRTLGVPIVRGRDFLSGDERGEGVVIVDERAARALWPRDEAVGRLVSLDASLRGPWLRVVGVVPDVHLNVPTPGLDPAPQIFVVGGPPVDAPARVVVRTDGPTSAATATAVHDALRLAAPDGVVGAVRPWLAGFERLLALTDFVSGVFLLFGAIALFLAACGQYGVLAFAVARRTREFGIRIALGASRRDVFRLVLREGVVLLLAGTAVGAVLAMWTAEAVAAWLYDVPPTDAVALVAAEAVLVAASLAACALPARRATRADPVGVLRAE